MAGKKIANLVNELISEFLSENGYELYRTEFVKEGRAWFLRVYIERSAGFEEMGIGTDDCERVSRFLEARLDEIDPIEQNYYLEVSSPGLDRELLTEKDYARFAGRAVLIRLYKALDGKKTIRGVLRGISDGKIRVADETGKQSELPMEAVAKAKLEVIF
ncbi:MAG: ribosome maturation factor RimP [Clostridiales Family XIII bacterium]|jgi:ribosome maturation factor RimP|nr:ribosome maturation factor RimP [Clostridiales Family XIII bacterium]